MSVLDTIQVDENDDVTYFSYRKAQVPSGGDIDETVNRNDYKVLENQLANAVELRTPDNHVVYGITMPDGSALYMWFHDLKIYVGSTYRLTGE